MAVTETNLPGNGTAGPFTYTFSALEAAHVKVSVDNVAQTVGVDYTLDFVQKEITFITTPYPTASETIRIYRETDDSALAATFYSGAAIRATDLNANFNQNLYVTQEIANNSVLTDGSNPMVGDLDMGGFKITNLGDPTSDDAAANKAYVDARGGNPGIPGYTRWTYNATGGETTLSGIGSTGGILQYSTPREQVFLNGALLQRGVDYAAADDLTITLLSGALLAGDVVDVRCVNNLVAGVSSTTDDITYPPQFTGAVTRTASEKLKDVVSVKDFGAVGDGVTNDAAAIQAAIDTGKSVFLPNGIYKLESPVKLSTTGQRLFGESVHNTYLTGGVNHDLLRIAAARCEVDHIHFRPDGASTAGPPTFASIRVYQAFARIHDNQFLSPVPGEGGAIYLDDVDPETSNVIAGAYTHVISCNYIGASGYEFKYCIYAHNANNGQQATKVQNNYFVADYPIYINQGGGNYYVGNLLQSRTGTYGSPVGTAISFGPLVTGETVTGNYIERYQYGVTTARAADQYIAFHSYGNHYDAVTNPAYSTGTANYVVFDESARNHYINSWQLLYEDQDNLKVNTREGVLAYNVNREAVSFEPRVLAFNTYQSLSYTADGQTQTPSSSLCEITGAGSSRTGCFLGNGTRDGQVLYLRGATWAVEVLNNPGGTQNIMFNNSAASATFGSGAGQVQMMQLIWDGSYGSGRWFEVSRTVI